MPAASVPDTLARLLALNGPGAPWQLTAEGTTVTGTWKLADAQWRTALGAAGVRADYRLVVELDPATGTFRSTERTGTAGGRVGPGGAAAGVSVTEGRTFEKSYHKTVTAPWARDRPGAVPPGSAVRSVDTRTLRRAVEGALADAGWQRRRGALARLFGAGRP